MQLQDSQKQKDFLKRYQGVNRQMEEQQASALSAQHGLQFIDLSSFPVDLNALALLTRQQAEDAEAVVFFKEGNDIRIGTPNPQNALINKYADELKAKNLHPTIYFISRASFRQVLALYDKVSEVVPQDSENLEIHASDADLYDRQLKSLESAGSSTGVNPGSVSSSLLTATQILEILLGVAAHRKASDIHLEPEERFVKVRLRLDGVLSDVAHLAKQYQKSLVSRIKILSKLKLNVENKPQDGRFSFQIEGHATDVRVSSLPSGYGESIVMRILSTENVGLDLDQLGFSQHSYALIKTELDKPNGMIVTTGPTGSGKTTTLYAFLKTLNQPGVKIITLEDPIEYKLEGINQTPIDPALTFAAGLRAILRQDPDIIMVGEIRDKETAETALQAALTGHVVLSTLHTNDAAGAIPRLINMEVKPFVIAPALNAIIAQRLVRKLCPDCKKEVALDETMLARVKRILSEIPKKSAVEVPAASALKFYHSPGCDKCANTGYRGRIGIYEVIVKSDNLDKLIMAGASSFEIKKAVVEDGMVTMAQDGLLKALAGITDVEEVFRVAGAE
jgi:type IV pilus assembly protein PilB